MKKWLILLFAIPLCACLEEPDAPADKDSFDSDPNVAYNTCEGCHSTMPPASAPHDATHDFFACNTPNCHGALLNENGTMAVKTHTNSEIVGSACENCHDDGRMSSDTETESPDTETGNENSCDRCHAAVPDENPHNNLHAQFACNDPNCHGPMIDSEGATILDDSKHMDDASEAACENCHGDNAGCTPCHQTPPSGAPHDDGMHSSFSCNNPSCHGDMINEAGTQILDSTKHMDGKSEVSDRTSDDCSLCH